MTKQKDMIVSVVGDVLSYSTGFPVSTLRELGKRLLSRRVDEAKEILIDELKSGLPGKQVSDEEVSMLFAYLEAAQNGTARVLEDFGEGN